MSGHALLTRILPELCMGSGLLIIYFSICMISLGWRTLSTVSENRMNDRTQLADLPKERKYMLNPHVSRTKTPLMTLESDLNLLTEKSTHFSSFISG